MLCQKCGVYEITGRRRFYCEVCSKNEKRMEELTWIKSAPVKYTKAQIATSRIITVKRKLAMKKNRSAKESISITD